jgi:PKD repeat protein
MERAAGDYHPFGTVQEVYISFGTGSIFTQFVSTSVEVTYDANAIDMPGGPTLSIIPNNNFGVIQTVSVPDGPSSYLFNSYNPSKLGYYAIGLLLSVQNGSGDYQGYGTISALTIRGEGYNPFTGQNNCEPLAQFVANPTTGNAPLTVDFFNRSLGADSYVWNLGDGNTSTAENITYTYNEAGEYPVTLTASNGVEQDTSSTTIIYVNDPDALPGAGLGRPLQVDDRYSNWYGLVAGSYDFDLGQQVSIETGSFYQIFGLSPGNAYSISNGVSPVMALESGDVKSVEKMSVSSCADFVGFPEGRFTGSCQLLTPGFIVDPANPLAGIQAYKLAVDDMYIVTVRYNERYEFKYLVSDPKVQAFQTISKGCIIGYTTKMLPSLPTEFEGIEIGADSQGGSIGGYFSVPDTSDKGATVIRLTKGDDQPERLLPLMVEDQTADKACNANPETAFCLGDPDFKNFDDNWTRLGTVDNTIYPIVLYPGSRIYMTMQLEAGAEYSFTVQAAVSDIGYVPGRSAKLTLNVGTTTSASTINETGSGASRYQSYSIALGEHSPDLVTAHTIGISNTGQNAIEILTACLSDREVGSATGACYFTNPSFDLGSSGWTVEDGESNPGAVYLNYGGSVAQNVHLLPPIDPGPDDELTYDMTITFEPWIRPGVSYSSTDYLLATFWFNVELGAGSGFEAIYDYGGTYNEGPIQGGNFDFVLGNTVTITHRISIPVETDELFTLQADISTSDPDILGIVVTEICLEGPHNVPNDDVFNGLPDPYEASCAVVNRPTSPDLSAWITYLQRSLERFFNCDLMRALSQMYGIMRQMFTTLTGYFSYIAAVINSFANWLTYEMLPWLNGHFRNIAVGSNITVISEGASEGRNLFDVLYLLIDSIIRPFLDMIISVIYQAVNLLFDIVTAFLGLFAQLFNELMRFVNTLLSWTTMLVDAWNNSTPQTIPGMPDCSASWTSSPFCMAAYVLENTAFSGTGALFIPLIIGFGSINLLLFVIVVFKETIEDAADHL